MPPRRRRLPLHPAIRQSEGDPDPDTLDPRRLPDLQGALSDQLLDVGIGPVPRPQQRRQEGLPVQCQVLRECGAVLLACAGDARQLRHAQNLLLSGVVEASEQCVDVVPSFHVERTSWWCDCGQVRGAHLAQAPDSASIRCAVNQREGVQRRLPSRP